jgi:hypothetical protein
MTISEFFKGFEISLEEDIQRRFELEKEFEAESPMKGQCSNCGDTMNYYAFPSEPWISVYKAICCNRVIVVIHSDRMSGTITDKVEVYKEKE